MFNAKTLQDINDVNFTDLETMNKYIFSFKAAHIYLNNIKDFKENCLTTIEKRENLSIKERSNFDKDLIQKLTKNYETKIEMLNDNLQEKENEIKRLEQELEDCPNPDLEFILEQKKKD